jgi:hypothetical protein
MKILIRAALMALNLATGIPAVANAANANNAPAPTQQDSTASWANG